MTTTLILLGLAALLAIAIYVANKAEKIEPLSSDVDPLSYDDAYDEAYNKEYSKYSDFAESTPDYGFDQPVIKLKKKKKVAKESSKSKNVPPKKKKKKKNQ